MSSMRLSDLRHSTSFRLGLLFAGFFAAALLLLFGFVYWWTRDYVVREVDAWLARETAGRAVLAAADVERTLNARAMVQPDDLHPIALFNSNGDWLAGTRVSLPQGAPPFDEPFRFTMQQGSEAALFRGIVHRMPTGEALLVVQDMRRPGFPPSRARRPAARRRRSSPTRSGRRGSRGKGCDGVHRARHSYH